MNREGLLAEALTWKGTPYHRGAMVKGVGCDCGSFLLGVLKACGLAQGEELARFADDWFCNTTEEQYLRRMMRNAAKIAEAISYSTLHALPGHLALTRSFNSKLYNHGGIVVKWPKVLHAVDPVVCEDDATWHELWSYRQIAIFDPFGKAEA